MVALTLWLTWFHEVKPSEISAENFLPSELADRTAAPIAMEFEKSQSILAGED